MSILNRLTRRQFSGGLAAFAINSPLGGGVNSGFDGGLGGAGYPAPSGNAAMLSAFGDSRLAAARILVNTSSNRQVFEAQTSPIQYALSAAGHRLFFPEDGGFGIAGNTTTQELARISDPTKNSTTSSPACGNFGVYAPTTHPSRYLVFWSGINDAQVLAPMQTNVLAIIRQLLLAGKIIFLFNETPVTTFGTSGSNFNNWIAYHQWLNTLAVPGRVIIVDSWSAILDPATDGTTYQPLAGTLIDDKHPNAYGAFLIGQALKNAIVAAGIPAFDYSQTPTSNTADAYNASTNPWGVINTNPLFPASAGGSTSVTSGSTISGSIVTGYTAQIFATGGTITGTVTQGTDGNGDYMDFAWTGTSGAGTQQILIKQDPSNATFGASDKFFIAAKLKFDASALVGVKDIAVIAGFTGSGNPSAVQAKVQDIGLAAGYASGLGTNVFTYATAPVDRTKLGGSLLSCTGRVLIDLTSSATTSGSLRLYMMSVRKWQWN